MKEKETVSNVAGRDRKTEIDVGNEGGRCYGTREKERMKKVKKRNGRTGLGKSQIKGCFSVT